MSDNSPFENPGDQGPEHDQTPPLMPPPPAPVASEPLAPPPAVPQPEAVAPPLMPPPSPGFATDPGYAAGPSGAPNLDIAPPTFETPPAVPAAPGPTWAPNLDIAPPTFETPPVAAAAAPPAAVPTWAPNTDIAPPTFETPPVAAAAAPMFETTALSGDASASVAVVSPPKPEPFTEQPGGAGFGQVPPTPSSRSAASKFDIGANVVLAGFVISYLASGPMTFISRGAFASGYLDTGLLGLMPAFIAVAAGMVAIFDPPGRAWPRNISIAAVLTLMSPFVLGFWATKNDSNSGEEIGQAIARGVFSPATVLAIAALVTIRHRKASYKSPYLVVGALVFANFFDALTDVTYNSEVIELAGAVTLALTKFGSLSLLFALALVVTDGRSEIMIRFMRHAAIAAGAGLALAYPIIRISGESHPTQFLWELPNSVIIVAIVGAVAFMAEPKVRLAPTDKPASGMGLIVFSAILFWPCGIVAMSHAAKAIASAEEGDKVQANIFAGKALKWRNLAFGIVAGLFILLQILAAR